MGQEVTVFIETEQEDFVPVYGTEGAAGADLRASIVEDLWILPGESALIPTGLVMEIPSGFEIQVRPRSGLALKHQVTVLNTPGTIDSDYRGPIGVILMNHGKAPFQVTRGMRIAQAVLAPVARARFVIEKKELSTTARGSGGFGHTGIL